MRFGILALAAATLLALPGVAAAKELSGVAFCGPSGCRDIDPASIRGFEDATGGPAAPAPAPGPYYEVRYTSEHEGHEESWTGFYVRSTGQLGFRDIQTGLVHWDSLRAGAAEAYRRFSGGLKPFAGPRITAVTVGGKPVEDPESYLALFELEPAPTSSYPVKLDWQPIVFRSERPSPWTNIRFLMYSPSANLLERGTAYVQVPEDVATAIEARSAIDLGGGFPWLVLALGLVLAALAVASAWIGYNVRRVPLPPPLRRATAA